MGASAMVAINNMNQPGFDITHFLAVFVSGIIVFSIIEIYRLIKDKRKKGKK